MSVRNPCDFSQFKGKALKVLRNLSKEECINLCNEFKVCTHQIFRNVTCLLLNGKCT